MSSAFSYTTEACYDEFFDTKNTRSKSSKEVTHRVWWGNNLDGNAKKKTNYYRLSNQENINFLLTYLSSISRKELNIGIATRMGLIRPLIIQININYDSKECESYETYDFVKKLIEETCDILNEKYTLSEDTNEFVCVYLYDKNEENNGKCNIRLVFPYFWCTEKETTQFIIPMLRKKMNTTNAYRLLCQLPKNEINMYSTVKDFLPLFMTCEEGVYYNDFIVFEKDHEIDINDVFVLENCIDELLDENIENDNQKIALITSIYYWRKPCKMKKNDILNSPGLVNSANSCSTNNEDESMDINDYFNEVYKLINNERKTTLYFREDMASILKSVYPREDESYTKWKSLFPNSDLIPTKEDWYKYTNEKLTINTLYYYASIDNKDQFDTWYFRTFCYKSLKKAYDEPYDANIAKAFKTVYPFQYVCVNHKQSNWYYFNSQPNGIWIEMDNDVDISNKISNEFYKLFEIFKKDEALFQDEKTNKRQKTKYEIISTILLSSGSKRSVVNELKSIYHNSRFMDILDSDNHLTAANNVMIDSRNNDVIIRDGRPEDYVSFCTGIPYHANPAGYGELKQYLRQLFVDKGIRTYMKYMISSLLYSGNKDKIFPIFTGEGNNSKSILVSIIEKALGRYAGKVPTSLITGKRTQSSSATPELRQLLKSRIAFAQEPSRDEILNVGLIKEITGNDSLYYRTLFKEGEVSKVNAILVLVCNRIPKIPDNQEAIWERVRVVPFKSKWVLNAPESEEEQFKNRIFKRDKYFDMKKSKMAISMLCMMVRKYKKYKEKGLEEPIEMYNATKHLREKTNIYQLFMSEKIDRVNDESEIMNHSIPISEFHQSFSAWYKIEYKGNKAPTRTTFIEEIEALLQTKADGNKFNGIKWKSNIGQISGIEFNI